MLDVRRNSRISVKSILPVASTGQTYIPVSRSFEIPCLPDKAFQAGRADTHHVLRIPK